MKSKQTPKVLSNADVRKVAGLSIRRFRNYLERDVLGRGRGHCGVSRSYTAVELLALTVAGTMEMSDCYKSRLVEGAMRYILAHTERQLEAEFERGNTFLLVTVEMIRLIPLPDAELAGSSFDVEQTWKNALQIVTAHTKN